jgi:hypothetical protein
MRKPVLILSLLLLSGVIFAQEIYSPLDKGTVLSGGVLYGAVSLTGNTGDLYK